MKKLVRVTTVPMSLNKLLEDQLKFMNTHFEVIAVSSNKESLEKVGEKEGVRTYAVEMTRKISPVKDFFAIINMYRFLRKEKPFIVHTHTPKAGLVGMLAAKFARVPYRLHTVAGLPLMEAKGAKRKLLNYVEKITYKCATKVYPNSFGLQQFIIENKFTKRSKLKVLGKGSSNGIDLNYFSPANIDISTKESFKKSYNIKEEDFVYIFVGRIVTDKGINELVTAFSKVNKEYHNVKLLLVGPYEDDLDPLKKETRHIIENNNNIINTGYQEDVRPFFSISNVLVFPSYREGFPNVVMQAGAMGLPSIVSNINGCNEIIINNINGSIIEPKEAIMLSEEMKKYVSNKDMYNKVKGNTRKIIQENYSRVSIIKEILNEYQSLS